MHIFNVHTFLGLIACSIPIDIWLDFVLQGCFSGAFFGSHTDSFPCRSLLLSTTVLNDIATDSCWLSYNYTYLFTIAI